MFFILFSFFCLLLFFAIGIYIVVVFLFIFLFVFHVHLFSFLHYYFLVFFSIIICILFFLVFFCNFYSFWILIHALEGGFIPERLIHEAFEFWWSLKNIKQIKIVLMIFLRFFIYRRNQSDVYLSLCSRQSRPEIVQALICRCLLN